jgi:hypothetical protein
MPLDASLNSIADYPDTNQISAFYDRYKNGLLVLLGVVILIFVAVFSLFNNSSVGSESRPWITAIEIILWIVLIVVIAVNIKWIYEKERDFTADIKNLFNDKRAEMEVHVKDVKEKVKDKDHDCDISHNIIKHKKKKCDDDEDGEVFHIPGNIYSYTDAKDLCSSLNSRLATYEEVETAYKNGGNWCSYGWSDEQMALFPIQTSVYNELKTVPGHERDCGRPGVNGGYISNANVKFGVNCYGKKPYITEKDKTFMEKYSFSPAFSDENLEKKENKIKDLLIAPFNKQKWNEF